MHSVVCIQHSLGLSAVIRITLKRCVVKSVQLYIHLLQSLLRSAPAQVRRHALMDGGLYLFIFIGPVV